MINEQSFWSDEADMGELNPIFIATGIFFLGGGVWMFANLKPPSETASKFLRSEAMTSIVVFGVLGTFSLGLSFLAYGIGWGQKF